MRSTAERQLTECPLCDVVAPRSVTGSGGPWAVGVPIPQKLVGKLAKKLEAEGIYVGEITVAGTIKGTSFDRGDAMSIDGKTVADKYWEMYTTRKDLWVTLRSGGL